MFNVKLNTDPQVQHGTIFKNHFVSKMNVNHYDCLLH